jgi:hypothetical protein
MIERTDQTPRDEWQTRLYETSYRCSVALRELHNTNPWPDRPVLEQAINTLATELWDQGFSLTEIRQAFETAAADLPRYTAGQEIRS